MNAEFNWWLLIVGVVVGGLLTWLVIADSTRREQDVTEQELPAEAGWLARTLADEGLVVDPATAEAMLRAHRRYLGLPPPDAFVDPDTLERVELEPDDPAVAAGPTAAPAHAQPADDPPRADAAATTSTAPHGRRPERGAAG